MLTEKHNIDSSRQTMLQFNPALAWTFSRPVSKTYGNQDPTSKSPKKWRAKVKTFFTTKGKKKIKESSEDENKVQSLPQTPSSSSSFIILGIEDAIERDGPLFTRPYSSSSSLVVQIGGDTPEELVSGGMKAADVHKEIWKESRRRGIWDPWEADIPIRAKNNEDYELERMVSEELRIVEDREIGGREWCPFILAERFGE